MISQEELLLMDPEVTSEITPEITTPITPKEDDLPMLINLEDDDITGLQSVQPRISQDILTLDWESYQKALIEEELKLTMKQQAIQTVHLI